MRLKKPKPTMKNQRPKKLLPTPQRKLVREISKLQKQSQMPRVSPRKRRRVENLQARDAAEETWTLETRIANTNNVLTEREVAVVVVVAEVEEEAEEATTEDHPLTMRASKLQERRKSPAVSTTTTTEEIVVVEEVVTTTTKITTAWLEKANVVEEDPKLPSPELRETTTRLMKARLRSEPRCFQKHLNKKNKLKSEIPTKIVQQNALKNHLDANCGQRVVY